MSFFNELKRRNVIRVATAYVVGSWLIIQVVETIFPVYGLGDFAIRTVITLLAVAFIPTLIFSWVFEITPEGLKREVEVVPDHSITRLTGRKLDRIIMMLLALAIAYFAFDKFALEPVRVEGIVEETAQQARSDALVESYGDQSIAVLPFLNLSADPEQEYFSDGISEEILNLLAQIPDLRVISRSSAFSFKGKDFAIPEVARQLNVGHVLEGSVRKSGDRVRITAQLIEARSDTHLWSETFERHLGDIFAIQDEIAGAITKVLASELGTPVPDPDAQRPKAIPTANTAAYDAYLRGHDLVNARGAENLENAISEFQRALRLDEEFAPAHAQLALAELLGIVWRDSDRQAALESADRHLQRARELQPDLAEVYYGRSVLAGMRGDLESAIAHARKALAVNPNYAEPMNSLQIDLTRMGRYEEAFEVMEKMLEIDPKSGIGRFNYCWWLDDGGQLEKARRVTDQMVDDGVALGQLAHAIRLLWYEGRIADGLSWALRYNNDFWIAFAFGMAGEYDEARRVTAWIADMFERKWDDIIAADQRGLIPNPNGNYRIAAMAHYYQNRHEEALALYERALENVPVGRPIWRAHALDETIRLAMSRRSVGDEEGALAALELARKDVAARKAASWESQQRYMAEAMIAAFEGDADKAIAALNTSIERGLRNSLYLEDPLFQDVQEEPEFITLRRKLDDLQAVADQEVRQLVCFNNPVPDEWQPMPETCERLVELRD